MYMAVINMALLNALKNIQWEFFPCPYIYKAVSALFKEIK